MRYIRLVAWPAFVVAASGIEWWSYDGGSVGLAAGDLLTGVAFLAGGMVAWEDRQREPVALAFFAISCAWFAGTLLPDLLYVHRAPLALLLLAYPTGRPSRLEGAVVAFALVDGLVVASARNNTITTVLAGALVLASVLSARQSSARERSASVGAMACAVLVGGALALGSVTRLGHWAAFSDTALLLSYEAALLVTALVLAIGIIIDRGRPGAVADLVVEHETGPQAETLRDALARLFGDPSLRLGYRSGTGYVDAEGRALTLSNDRGQARMVIEQEGEPIAVVVHDAAVPHDPRFDQAVATALRLASSNARLQAELRGQVRELGDSRRRMIEAGDAQRRRLERRLRKAAEVHLEEMRHALARAGEASTPEVVAAIEAVQCELEQTVEEIHDLARGIHPRTLTEGGLAPALAELAATVPAAVSVEAPGERFPPALEVAAYFVCAEALANITKYAHAQHAAVGVRQVDGWLRVAISDDGIGGADVARGSGLRGLTDRVEAVGGRLSVSSPTSGGTAVIAELPLAPLA